MTGKIYRFFWVLSFFVVFDEANGQVKIVSSLPDYASIAESIGGEKIEVTSIAKGYQDAHFVKAKPSLPAECPRQTFSSPPEWTWSFGFPP